MDVVAVGVERGMVRRIGGDKGVFVSGLCLKSVWE